MIPSRTLTLAALVLVSLSACGNDSQTKVPLHAAPAVHTDDLCAELDGVSTLASTSKQRWTIADSTADGSSNRFENVKECDITGTTPASSFTISARITSYGAHSAEAAEANASDKPGEMCASDDGGDVTDGICHLDYSRYSSAPHVSAYQHVPGTSTVLQASVASPSEAEDARVTRTADEVLEVLERVATRETP